LKKNSEEKANSSECDLWTIDRLMENEFDEGTILGANQVKEIQMNCGIKEQKRVEEEAYSHQHYKLEADHIYEKMNSNKEYMFLNL